MYGCGRSNQHIKRCKVNKASTIAHLNQLQQSLKYLKILFWADCPFHSNSIYNPIPQTVRSGFSPNFKNFALISFYMFWYGRRITNPIKSKNHFIYLFSWKTCHFLFAKAPKFDIQTLSDEFLPPSQNTWLEDKISTYIP